jgi:hypothetical protein
MGRSLTTVLTLPENFGISGVLGSADGNGDDSLVAGIHTALVFPWRESNCFTGIDRYGTVFGFKRYRPMLDDENFFLIVVAVIAIGEAIARGQFVVIEGDVLGTDRVSQWSEDGRGIDPLVYVVDVNFVHTPEMVRGL